MRVFLAIISSLLLGVPAMAQSGSVLEQQITVNNCQYTTIETGLGTVNDSTCPPFAPSIAEINLNGGRPIITGVYDAAHTTFLRVRFGGVWYTYGSSAELVTDGSVWTLDLSNLERPLQAGEYALLVETENTMGEMLRVERNVTVPPKTSTDDPQKSQTPPIVEEGENKEETRKSELVVTPEIPQPNQPVMEVPIEVVAKSPIGKWIIAGIILIAATTVALFVLMRRRGRSGE